jgi:hypothetical protein
MKEEVPCNKNERSGYLKNFRNLIKNNEKGEGNAISFSGEGVFLGETPRGSDCRQKQKS